MRFKIEPKYVLGDYRIITKFLFLPVVIDNEVRWLEKVTIRQRYYEGFAYSWWENLAWIDEEK